jgi:hypothetical protein
VLAWTRGHRALGELLLLASYAWVSRDLELPVIAATVLAGSAVGHALGQRLRGEEPPRPSAVLAIVTFLFALGYLQRIGVQQGVDFTHFDWGAGAFRQPGVSLVRIGAALAYKHGFARAALVFAVLSALPPRHRSLAARGLFAAEAIRAAVLTVMLYACGSSFWTSLRVIGDLPHALAAVVVAALAVVAVALAGEGKSTHAPLQVAPQNHDARPHGI